MNYKELGHSIKAVLRDRTLEVWEYFGFPAERQDQPYRSFVGRSQTAEFQTVVTPRIGELMELFGR